MLSVSYGKRPKKELNGYCVLGEVRAKGQETFTRLLYKQVEHNKIAAL